MTFGNVNPTGTTLAQTMAVNVLVESCPDSIDTLIGVNVKHLSCFADRGTLRYSNLLVFFREFYFRHRIQTLLLVEDIISHPTNTNRIVGGPYLTYMPYYGNRVELRKWRWQKKHRNLPFGTEIHKEFQ